MLRLVLVLLLAASGLFDADAQELPHQCSSTAAGCDQGTAYSRCMTELSAYIATRTQFQHQNQRCELQGASSYRSMFEYRSGSGGWLSGGYRSYFFVSGCSSRQSKTTLFYPPSGSVGCDNGCQVKYRQNGDDETTTYSPTGGVCANKPTCEALDGNYIWNGYLNVCQPVVPECQAGYIPRGAECVKEDSCPDGMSLQNGICKAKEDTCPPGQIRAPNNQCVNDQNVCKAGEAMSSQGTCAKDSDGDGIVDREDDDIDGDGIPNKDDPDADGDGVPDDEQEGEGPGKKDEASGGDTCDRPPSCTGNPIDCLQARIQWRIDCNTRKKANISGGHCGPGGMPICAGDGCDEREHQQLIQQWKAACLLEKIAASSAGSPGGNPGGGDEGTVPTPDTSGVSDGDLADQVPEDKTKDDAHSDESGYGGDGPPGSDGFNTGGYGWARSCPSPPTIDLLGQSITLNIGPFCDWMALGGWLVLIMASLLSLRILASAGN
jgi:hypothetical protein